MVAGKLATLKRGRPSEENGQICTFSIDDAAGLLSVSPRSVKSAKQVIEHGSKAMVDAVEKLDDEYRKAVEAIADAQPKGGRPKKDEKPPQIIVEVNRSERETDHKLAKANGTNRTYLNDARKVLAGGRILAHVTSEQNRKILKFFWGRTSPPQTTTNHHRPPRIPLRAVRQTMREPITDRPHYKQTSKLAIIATCFISLWRLHNA
jgi:hypothetical protein